jgi:hypothetical protein
MGRDPKRKQSSGEVFVILFNIKQNLKWSINFIKNHKYETFMKIRPGASGRDRQGRKTDMTKLRVTICNYSATSPQKGTLMSTTKFNLCMYRY